MRYVDFYNTVIHTDELNQNSWYLFVVSELAELVVGSTVELEVEQTAATCPAPSTRHGLDHALSLVQSPTCFHQVEKTWLRIVCGFRSQWLRYRIWCKYLYTACTCIYAVQCNM